MDRSRARHPRVGDEHPAGRRRRGADVLRGRAGTLTEVLEVSEPSGVSSLRGPQGTTNAEAFETARGILPGGVDSPVRAFGSVGGTPRSYVSGRGPYLTDVEGREYVDLVGQWGP